jgi:hypothetical protein
MRCSTSSSSPAFRCSPSTTAGAAETPLWDRLEKEGRLIGVKLQKGGTNVDFLMPYDEVVTAWKRAMKVAYEPAKLFDVTCTSAVHL